MFGFRKYSIIIPCLIIAQSLFAQQQETCYDAELTGIGSGKVAVYIENLCDGSVLADINAEEPMVPASVTKIVTASNLIHRRCLDEKYHTDIVASGNISGNILNGNIVIKACGDPTIESAYFPKYHGIADSIARAVQRLGIDTIRGSIEIISPEWLEEPIPAGWATEDVNHPYGAGHHALNYADNRIAVSFSCDSIYTITPSSPGVILQSATNISGAKRSPGSCIYLIGHKNKKKAFQATLANPSPQSALQQAILTRLEALGIIVEGGDISISDRHKLIYTHVSPTIADILKSMLLRSDNQMAEAMLRYCRPEMTRRNATLSNIDDWSGLGVNMDDVTLEDGSGLSRSNRLTAYALADLLVWMKDNEPEFDRFLTMLPSAGRTGTLRSFLKDTPLEGRLLAKTGSMSGVQSYAGYIVDEQNRPTHVVVIMVNGFTCSRDVLKRNLSKFLIDRLFPPATEENAAETDYSEDVLD